VIDRQEVDQLLDEQTAQALAENRDLPSAMGSLRGCDYLMIGSLQNFSMEEETLKLPNSSRVMEVLDGFAEGNMRLVDARSGDIMESRKISVGDQLDIQAGEDRLIAALADSFAAKVVANLLNAVYPMKVAAVAPDATVYVNRGRDGLLARGAVLDVMRPGRKVIDPDTGVELGSMDSLIGQIKLTTVEENRSLGSMVDGSGVQPGDLLKLVKTGNDDKSTESTLQRSGGVLPGTVEEQRGKSSGQQKTRRKATLALAKITLNARQKFDDSSKISAILQGTMNQLTDNVADALSKTNRFSMMERRQIDQVIDEKTFQAVAQGGDIRDYLKELEGSDYLVVGELTNFYLHIRKNKVPYLDEYEVSYTGFIEGNQRIVDSHTSRVLATEKVRIKKKFKNIGIEEIRTKLIDMYAADAADGIVQRIYPMKILGVMADGIIFINRGADTDMKVGSTFSVERPGQELIDPDTGVSFGAAETTIGTLKITSVEAYRSRAQMVDGVTPAAGDILRNKKVPEKPAPKPKMKVAW
jgi:curli biogenesis system outer membrane secretion channel CsgG